MQRIWLGDCSGPASDEDSLGYYVAIELSSNKDILSSMLRNQGSFRDNLC